MADFTICQGDVLPPFAVTLEDETGLPPNLTGVTSVTFSMALWHASTAQVDAQACDVITADAGIVEYQWQSGDTAVPGVFQARIVVVNSDSQQKSYPNGDPWEVAVTAAIPA